MATWHQRKAMKRNPIRLDHATEWTVVINPPHGLMALMRFTTKQQADVYVGRVKDSYILPPRSSS
jgi:hypothetical protein